MRHKGLTSILADICLHLVSNAAVAAQTSGALPSKVTAAQAKVSPKPQYGGTLKMINSTGLVNLGYPGKQFLLCHLYQGRPATARTRFPFC